MAGWFWIGTGKAGAFVGRVRRLAADPPSVL